MKTQLLTLVLGVGLVGWISPAFQAPPQLNPLAEAIELTPPRMGSFVRQSQTWKIRFSAGHIEDGALYSNAELPEVPIQLDFYRGLNKDHNGLVCYLAQGETLLWIHTRSMSHHGQDITMQWGLTRSEDQLRLTAVTVCGPNRCHAPARPTQWSLNIQHVLGLGKTAPGPPNPSPDPQDARGDSIDRSRGLVPMSIVITQRFSAGQQERVQQLLQDRLQLFLEAFDFDSVMQLARLQD
jgi:hypothetical protein